MCAASSPSLSKVSVFALERNCVVSWLTVLIGDFTLEDTAKPGEIRKVKKGDISYVSKGSTVKWGSESGGKCVSIHLS